MDNYHLKEFSPDQKLFAIIQNDGKLKIWDVESNQLKLEYVPNLHLSTPCTALKWIRLSTNQKKKSKSDAGSLHIILGTNKGGLALFSIATAKIEAIFQGEGHSAAITSIDHDNSSFIFSTGFDAQVIKWNIKNCKQESSFDCGPEKPTALCIINNGERIVTASKNIKVYENSVLLQTFTGHSTNIISLQSFTFDDEQFILSASKADRNLSLWKIGGEKKTGAAATFTLLNNTPNCVNYKVEDDGLQIACICRSDSVAFFDTSLSSLKSKKPIKAKFTLEIASDGAGKVDHIPINAVTISGEDLLIGYGDMLMKFEYVTKKQAQKNTILVRKDPLKIDIGRKKKDDQSQSLNVVTPITDKNVEILNVVSATKRALKPVEIPLETRLDNLTVGESRRPNAKKMTHQLVQGLQGHDATILRNVLRQTDEETIRLTVKYLPTQYVMSLVNELSLLMTKKTSGSETALIWLRFLIQTHASSLMSYGIANLNATFGTTLGIIDHRTQNLPALSRLRGRLDLLVKQVKQSSDIDEEVHNENLLVYEDSDDESIYNDGKSESSEDDIFDEFDDEEEMADQTNEKVTNGKASDSEEDDNDDDEEMDYSD